MSEARLDAELLEYFEQLPRHIGQGLRNQMLGAARLAAVVECAAAAVRLAIHQRSTPNKEADNKKGAGEP